MLDDKRTVIIREAELHWAKVVTPVSPFGTSQWEVQIRTRDEKKAKEWKDKFYLTTKTEKDDDGVYYKSNIKRKAINKDGNPNTPPEVLDGNKQSIDGTTIGNGSIGNIMLFQYPYDVSGRKGVGSILSKIQVTELLKYQPTQAVDFEIEDNEDVPEEIDKVDF